MIMAGANHKRTISAYSRCRARQATSFEQFDPATGSTAVKAIGLPPPCPLRRRPRRLGSGFGRCDASNSNSSIGAGGSGLWALRGLSADEGLVKLNSAARQTRWLAIYRPDRARCQVVRYWRPEREAGLAS